MAGTGPGRRDGVEPAAAPRMATEEAPDTEPPAAQGAVGFDRLEHVVGARGLETASASGSNNTVEYRRDDELVGAYEEAKHFRRGAIR